MYWKKFQEVTAQLFRQIGCTAKEDVRVKGARAEHDIDVLVTFDAHGFKVKWVLECKAWNTNIPKEKVLALKSIVNDIGADKGLIICKKGFQPGAIKSAENTNIELISLDDLRKIISSNLIPYISTSKSITIKEPRAAIVSDAILQNLRNPKAGTHPDIYREYLLKNGCQRTQKAAATGLSKIPSSESIVLLVERLGNFWGVSAIKSSINALSKIAGQGSILGLLATVLLDSRFYYEKLEATAKSLVKIGDQDTYNIIQAILRNKLPNGMEASYRLSKKVPNDIECLLACKNREVIHGLVLASFFNQSIWAEDVVIEGAIDESIEYADEVIPGLVNAISKFDLAKWHQI